MSNRRISSQNNDNQFFMNINNDIINFILLLIFTKKSIIARENENLYFYEHAST